MPPPRGHIYKLTAYPKDIHLRDGVRVTLKPMTSADEDALLRFFLRIPAEERHYLKEDVTSPKVIKRWAEEMDYDRALPLLAWVDGRVVADGSLHRTRTMARRHVGELRIVVDPAFRLRGMGTILMHELGAIAREHGLERVMFEAVGGMQDEAVKAAEFMGFMQIAVLPGYGKDLNGHPRDILLMEMPLGKWFDWWNF